MSEKASDLRQVERVYDVGGKNVRMRFDNYTYAVAEEVYETQFKKDVNFTQILVDLGRNKQRAILTVVYAALISAGSTMSFRDFCAEFSFGDLVRIGNDMVTGIMDSMPEDNEKNG